MSFKNHLQSEIPGGVQVCTKEYYELLEYCGFTIEPFVVEYTSSYYKRIKIKLGIEVYDRFDLKKVAKQLFKKIQEDDTAIVALNQVDFIRLAPLIKGRFGDQVKVVILSHGNFSGDFLHEITRGNKGYLKKVRDTIRLGYAILTESNHFIHSVDVVLCLSETEKQINNWLGCPTNIFIPRILTPNFLKWEPNINHVGFVGTLNHPPNYIGLTRLLDALKSLDLGSLRVRVVGKPKEEGQKLSEMYDFVDYVGHLTDKEFEQEASTWAFFLNPIFWYSRGATTKLAQGINWGLPIISTPAGNRGYSLQDGDILNAQNPKEMANLMLQHLTEVQLKTMAEQIKKVAQNGPTKEELSNIIQSAFI